MLTPINTTEINEECTEEKLKQLIMEESLVLSNRLNQLRYKIRTTERDKLEIKAISKQIEILKEELERLEDSDKKK